MAVVLNKRNNIKLEIKAPMTSVGTLLVVDKGTLLGEDFANDATKNFSLTLFKLEGDVPVQIEIAEVIAKSGNNLTLRRAVEPCPMNYGAGEMVQQAYDFDVGDVAYMNLTAGDLEDIITELKNTNTRIDTTNTNILNNYVSNAQLQAQKGQPGGIATLDDNSKIPGTQINTATLEVSALNQEFIAGENIQAGDVVVLGPIFEIKNLLTQNKTITVQGGSGQSLTPGEGDVLTTINLNAGDIIVGVLFNTQCYGDYGGKKSVYITPAGTTNIVFSGSFNDGVRRQFVDSLLNGTNIATINSNGNYDIKIKNYEYQYSYSSVEYSTSCKLYIVKNSHNINPNTIYKSNIYNQNCIGIALNNATKGNKVVCSLFGIYSNFTNLLPGREYYLNKLLPNQITLEKGKIKVGVSCSTTNLFFNKEICNGYSGSISFSLTKLTNVTTWRVYTYLGYIPSSISTNIGSISSITEWYVDISYSFENSTTPQTVSGTLTYTV